MEKRFAVAVRVGKTLVWLERPVEEASGDKLVLYLFAPPHSHPELEPRTRTSWRARQALPGLHPQHWSFHILTVVLEAGTYTMIKGVCVYIHTQMSTNQSIMSQSEYLHWDNFPVRDIIHDWANVATGGRWAKGTGNHTTVFLTVI